MKKTQKKRFIIGGVTAPKGFRAAGVEAGIKYASRKDFALLVSDQPAAAAAVFTTNQVAAAPVQLDRAHIRGGKAQAVAIKARDSGLGRMVDDDELERMIAKAQWQPRYYPYRAGHNN